MTCLVDEVLDRAGMKSHTSLLGTFFVCTMELRMPVFKKKNFPETSRKKFQTFSGVSGNIFFLKIDIRSPKVYTKNVPNREECDFIPALSRTSSIKQIIVVLYY